jgi:hypothetical protein
MKSSHSNIVLYMSLPLVILGISIIVGYAKNQYDYEQSLPSNCTVDNLEQRINELHIISALPIPSTKYGASTSVIDKNLRSMDPIRGCPTRLNDALEMTEYSLRDLNFIQYAKWRAVLIAELQTLQEEHK